VLFDKAKGRVAARQIVVPIVMKIERRAVVNQPQLLFPNQQVDIARRAIHIGHIGVKPDNLRRKARVRRRLHQGVIGKGGGQKAHPQIQPDAGLEQILNLLVWLIQPKAALKLDQDKFGNGQPQRAPDLPGNQFGHKRLDALTRTPKFDHIQFAVICLDQRRQRTAFTKGCNVSCG
jgi:hypothetical protein